LERMPWLLPVAWARQELGSCDPVVIAEELEVPVRLARSLVWRARLAGLCDEPPRARIVRRGREFAAETSAFYLYARVQGRRVRGEALSKSGAAGARARLVERVIELLGLA